MTNCALCKINLELINYSKDKYRPSGLDATCKKCRKKQNELRKKARADNTVISQKTCLNCKNTFGNTYFDKNPNSIDKLHNECKECKKQKRLIKKQKNKGNILPDDYTKICNECNLQKNKCDFYNQLYSTDGIGTICIECDKIRHKNWNIKNPTKKAEYRSIEYFKNYKVRREANPQFKLSGNIRNRIRMALKRQESSKFKNTFKLIDCSPYLLKMWLEFQFDESMNWGNYGTYWEIDHIIPCDFFDLKNIEDQLKCFNWRNCRPLESIKNRIKNSKIQPLQIHLQEIKVRYYERHIQIAGNS
jgi:hypothetical protein